MLQKLDLNGNQIRDQGTQLLADALKQNKVKCIFLPHLHHYHLYSFTQKLTILNLSRNKIDDEGATHLANALKENEVNCILYSCVS
jgi:Ran GTPase-activating protein (RanGAP) involved in mRNA processing and transport